MKSAPKDGTVVLIALPKPICGMLQWITRQVATGYFQAQGDDWVIEGNWARENHLSPMYWAPLPDPPAKIKGKK